MGKLHAKTLHHQSALIFQRQVIMLWYVSHSAGAVWHFHSFKKENRYI